jgi:pyruvate/2-oxoglutarate dehydrogenase complex dihydrolipoamide acyltransferase (E2) component
MGTDLLSDIRREIDARLEELRPALAEYQRLLRAADALELDGGGPPARAKASQTRAKAPQTRAPQRQSTRARVAPAGRRAARILASTRRAPASTERADSIERTPTTQGRGGRAVRGATREAILGVLEHGSHTVGELAVVTAMSAASLNGNLRKLASQGVVAKTRREGKIAWSLIVAD